MQTLCQHASIIAHSNNADGPAIQTAPLIGAVHTPMMCSLCRQQFLCVIAVLQHKINAVLCQNRSTAPGSTRHRDPACKYFRTGRTIQAGVITVDPL